MPKRATVERARSAKRKGKMPSSQAGEFVREEIRDIRRGKHGARSTKQAIAIGLSKARRAGVNLPPPKEGTTSERTRRSAERAYESGRRGKRSVISSSFESYGRRPQARRPTRGLEKSIVQTDAFRGSTAHASPTFGFGATSRADQRPPATFRSRSQGCAHACPASLIVLKYFLLRRRWRGG